MVEAAQSYPCKIKAELDSGDSPSFDGILTLLPSGFAWIFDECPQVSHPIACKDIFLFAKQDSKTFYAQLPLEEHRELANEFGCQDEVFSVWLAFASADSAEPVFEWYKQCMKANSKALMDDGQIQDEDDCPEDFEVPSHIQILEPKEQRQQEWDAYE